MHSKKTAALFLALLAVFLFAGYKLVTTWLDYRQSEVYYEGLTEAFVQAAPTPAPVAGKTAAPVATEPPAVTETPKEAATEVIAAPTPASSALATETPAPTPAAPAPPISVDFARLREINPDVVGWIYCEDTAINYPVLRGANNDVYLHRQLDGSQSYAGSIFMDSACAADFSDDNTVLYGHNMKNGSMFAGLPRFGEAEYFAAHPRMWLLTPAGNWQVRLFAAFVTKAGDWAYAVNFEGATAREAFLDQATAASSVDSGLRPAEDVRLLTLSTCNYSFDKARYVVIGELIAAWD